MSLTMTKQEREAFLADVHVGISSIPEPGRGPLTVPVWYAYDRGGELRVVTARTSRKGQLLARADRFSLCAQTETPPYKYVSVEGPIVAIEDANVERDLRPRSCTPTLRRIPWPPKPDKMPPSQDILDGATPWSHTFFTTNLLCGPSSGSSSCCMSPRPNEA
jgi:nitroimidazol reductase NimA-like FMN-containing flavoprotein (pyridoxamine 5'-phosphate oxidase superfamily)